MIQDARHPSPDAPALTSAKARLRSAARRSSAPRPAPTESPKQATAQLIAENPTASAAVAFALVAAVGPGKLWRAGSFALRAAPLAMVAWKAINAAPRTPPSSPAD